jgi:hypothetical protein
LSKLRDSQIPVGPARTRWGRCSRTPPDQIQRSRVVGVGAHARFLHCAPIRLALAIARAPHHCRAIARLAPLAVPHWHRLVQQHHPFALHVVSVLVVSAERGTTSASVTIVALSCQQRAWAPKLEAPVCHRHCVAARLAAPSASARSANQ